MTTDMIIALILFFVAMSFALVGSMIYYYILGEVNGKLEEKIPFLGVDPIKGTKILQEHKRQFPESRMQFYFGVTFVMGIAFFLGATFFFFQS